MIAARERLSDRRASEQIAFTCGGFKFIATVSRFFDGRLAEIFLTNGKCGSDSDVSARDAAIVDSIALQHGARAEAIRHVVTRNADGNASGPIGALLDILGGGHSDAGEVV